jgi:hypothetical protein
MKSKRDDLTAGRKNKRKPEKESTYSDKEMKTMKPKPGEKISGFVYGRKRGV